jgi:hypothetical protein
LKNDAKIGIKVEKDGKWGKSGATFERKKSKGSGLEILPTSFF